MLQNLTLYLEPTNDETEKNGMQESEADPVIETLNETSVPDNQGEHSGDHDPLCQRTKLLFFMV